MILDFLFQVCLQYCPMQAVKMVQVYFVLALRKIQIGFPFHISLLDLSPVEKDATTP